jgi:hypothetical protein
MIQPPLQPVKQRRPISSGIQLDLTRSEIAAIMTARGFPETEQSVRYAIETAHAKLAANREFKKLAVEVGLWAPNEPHR